MLSGRAAVLGGAFLLLSLALSLPARAQVDAVAKRPFYTLNVVLDPTSGRANGSVLVQYVNPTEDDLYNIAFALDSNSRNRITRARVNRRTAEVQWRSKEKGDAYDGFELVSSRRMPPNVISQIEIQFETRVMTSAYGLSLYTGDWFPRVLGQVDTTGVPLANPDHRNLADYDVTVEFPIDWRGAMSGLPLREDGRGDAVEIYNGAAGVTNYGVALGRDLLVQETEVFGIRLRVFFHPQDAEWGTRTLADARSVLEYFKRRTAYKPPLILNVIPGDADAEGAEAAYGNTLVVHRGGPRPGSAAAKIAIAQALSDLYWGFDNVVLARRPATAMEEAFTSYGALRYSRGVGLSDSWTSELMNDYYAGLLFKRLTDEGWATTPADSAFHRATEVARHFTLMRLLERRVGVRSMERVYDELFVFSGQRDVNVPRLRDVVAVVAEDSLDDFFDTWYDEANGWMDTRLREVAYWGEVSGKHQTQVLLSREGATDMGVPVELDLLDSTSVEQTLEPGQSELIFRTESRPAQVQIDPEGTVPLLLHAWQDEEAVAKVASQLGQNGDWGRASDVLRRAEIKGAERNAEFLEASAECRLHTGDYLEAKEEILEALNLEASGRRLLLLGMVLDLLGDRAGAEDAYRRAQGFGATEELAAKYLKDPYTQKPED